MTPQTRRALLKLVGGAVTLGGTSSVGGAHSREGRSEELATGDERTTKFIIRPAKSHQGSQSGTCATNGEWTKFAESARLPNGTTTYRLENVPTEFEGAIAYSFKTWAEVAEIISFDRNSESNNVVKFESLGERILGIAFVTWRKAPGPQRIIQFEISVNNDVELGNLSSNPVCRSEGAVFNVQDIVTHEVGHAVGLGHAPSPESIGNTMNPFGFPGSTFASTLAEGDRNGAHALYHPTG